MSLVVATIESILSSSSTSIENVSVTKLKEADFTLSKLLISASILEAQLAQVRPSRISCL
jgi:hypothetical protein